MAGTLKTAARNLVFLLLVAVPLGILTGWIEVLLFPPEWMKPMAPAVPASEGLSTFAFWYLVLLLPVLLGGCLHQVALRFVPPRRLMVLLTTPIVLLGPGVLGHSLGEFTELSIVAPIVISLLAYGMIARPLSRGGT